MNMRRGRSNRGPLSKQFLPGGVYDANAQFQQQNNLTQVPIQQQVQVTAQVQPAPQTPVVQQQEQPQQPSANDLKQDNQMVEETPVKVESTQASTDDNSGDNEKRANKAIFKTIFLKRKKSSVRLKEKKLRQNRQLRKALLPKNALMALNEVKGVNISDFIITNAATNNGFTAVVTVNDIQYQGKGHSKMAAKNDACEKALRDYVIEKMRQHPRNIKKQDVESMDTAENNLENGTSENTDNDVPMINLASFALFKLFSVWESEGFEIPEMHPGGTNVSGNVSNPGSDAGGVTKEPNKPTIRTELPGGWENLHPATLLCLMRPGLTYNDTPTIGDNIKLQTVYVVVDDVRFDGIGRSKKIARRNAAALACNEMFGTNFLPVD